MLAASMPKGRFLHDEHFPKYNVSYTDQKNNALIKKLLKTLFKSGKTATESVGKSMDFIDDILEKEYITGAVENVKESTGKIVEKAGMVYQQTKDTIDDTLSAENIKEQVDKVVQKGKEATSDLGENMRETSDTLKNVMKEGENIVRKITGEEE